MAKYEREQRHSVRRNVVIRGCLVARDGSRMSCTLQDISETGAQIIFDGDFSPPDEFALEIEGNATVRRLCRVVRRGEHSIGVRFPGREVKGR